ncbi:MAG: alpha/beta hydrolase [Alphaproteobacteria bacterium]|nr:alpha/beta hydrolase [Alphaproteobacteria bacterium]
MNKKSPTYQARHFIAQDGLRLYYRDYGDPLSDKSPLLCLAGLTRNSSDFHALAVRFAKERRILALDYRGRGRSEYDPDWRNYQARTYLNDVRHLLAATGVHRIVIVGTSLGGILGMAMGAVMPTALAGVILNDVGPDIHPKGLARIIAYIREDRPQPDWPSAARHLEATVPYLSIHTAQEWEDLARRTYREGADGLLHFDWDIRIAEPLLRHRGPVEDLWHLYHALRRIPALVLRGELSDILTPETLERMAAEKPDLVQATVPGCGHVPLLNEPVCLEAIERFLETVDAGNRPASHQD